MEMKELAEIPPWDWPENAIESIVEVLLDRAAPEAERSLAAELSADLATDDREITDALLSVARDEGEAISLRAAAAGSLGPVLEEGDLAVLDMEDPEGLPEGFAEIRETVEALFRNEKNPTELRRRALEASVHAPEDWHTEAIQTAYSSEDDDWKLTAVFCMRFVRGFDEEIVEALAHANTDIAYEALCAAGVWGVSGAWQRVTALVESETTDKRLLVAAIEAVPSIRPDEAQQVLGRLVDSPDEEIAEAAGEALSMAEGPWSEDGEGDEEDDEA